MSILTLLSAIKKRARAKGRTGRERARMAREKMAKAKMERERTEKEEAFGRIWR